MWQEYINVTSLQEAVQILAKKGAKARIIAGATDLLLEMERKVRGGIETLIDISRVPDLDLIVLDEKDVIHLGAMVTHNQCVSSKLLFERAFPLSAAAWEIGAPQIRNRGTVAGNLITASPANDTISPLMAMGAKVKLISSRGERIVPLEEFYRGVRKTVMNEDELLVEIQFPAMQLNQRGTFNKLGLRNAQAISLVNASVVLTFGGEESQSPSERIIEQAQITLGAVAPTIIHASEAEDFLKGKTLTNPIIEEAARLAQTAAKPIDDLRSSAEYRADMVRVCVLRGLRALANCEEKSQFPQNPVLLWGKKNNHKISHLDELAWHDRETPIETIINGKEYQITGAGNKTLLRMLREDVGLIGTKEGCAEGECGACTVYLDGVAVMACLVPAPRAQHAQIVTIEGLAHGEKLHPVQQAFIEEGAVQCGYCTPGFIMSAAKLLEEKPQPTDLEIKQSITGNLCRCTGYYAIMRAIEKASLVKVD